MIKKIIDKIKCFISNKKIKYDIYKMAKSCTELMIDTSRNVYYYGGFNSKYNAISKLLYKYAIEIQLINDELKYDLSSLNDKEVPSNFIKIESVDHLKQLCTCSDQTDGLCCFITLGGGIARSYKSIWFENDIFHTFNYIDDTEQDLTVEELYTASNIGEAIKTGNLWIDTQ